LNEVVRDVDAARDRELVSDRLVEVEAARRAARTRVQLETLALLVVDAEVEARVARTARRREDRLVRRIGHAVQLLLPVVPLATRGRAIRLGDRVRLRRAAEPVLHGERGSALAVQIATEVTRAQVLHHVLRADALRDVVARLAGLA